MSWSARTVATTVAVVGAVAFGVAAWLLVPWGAGGSVSPVSATDIFTPAEITRGSALAGHLNR